MTFKTTIALIILLTIALLAASGSAFYYRGNAIDFKSQRDKASGELKMANATINDMQVRQRDVAALDAKYTKELADANAENDRLSAKLAAGGRVRVTGECKPKSTTSATSGSVGNAGTVELSPVAGSNVLSIRAGIISDQSKVRYLQQYILEQCQ